MTIGTELLPPPPPPPPPQMTPDVVPLIGVRQVWVRGAGTSGATTAAKQSPANTYCPHNVFYSLAPPRTGWTTTMMAMQRAECTMFSECTVQSVQCVQHAEFGVCKVRGAYAV